MGINRFYLFTIIIITSILGYLSYTILKSFLSPIAWAIMLTIVFYPLYLYICRFIKWKTLSSVIALIIAVTVLLGPFSYLSVGLAKELKAFAKYINTEGLEQLQSLIASPRIVWVQERVKSALHIEDIDLVAMLTDNISKAGKDILTTITKGVSNIAVLLFNFFIMVFAMFYMFRDGPEFLKAIRNYLPFSEVQKENLELKMKDMVISTVYGGLVVAVLQGSVGGLAFLFLGLQSPVLLGTLIGLISFIPVIGPASVWVPVVIYFFIKKMFIKAIILLFVGIFGLGTIDNILKPIIISGRTQMPTLMIFFSVLGGLKVFGIIGLIMGPLILAIFISVLEIFRNIEGGLNAES